MAAPSTAITRLDLSLTYQEFSLLANQMKFIGLLVLPPLGVQQEASDFARINIASLLTKVEDTRRAPKSTYNRDSWEWTKDSYNVEEHGVEESVDDASVERYGDVIRVEQLAVMRAINRVLMRLEYDIARTILDPSIWSGAELTTAVGTTWSNKDACDPVADIDAAHDKVSAGCGMEANTLLLTKKTFRNMLRSTRLESLLKYDASELLIALNNEQNGRAVSQIVSGLKDLLQVERILIGRGVQNIADKGQPPSLSRVWEDDKAMLCVTHDDGFDGDLENPMPCIGRTIFSTKNGEPLPGADDAGLGSLIMDEYRDESVRGSIIRPRNKRQVKILHKETGHLLTGLA